MTAVEEASVDPATLVVASPSVAGAVWTNPVVVATGLAGVLHLLWWKLLATPGGDIAAQDAWAAFAEAHPGSAYDLAWYGGMHPVSYSAISPYLMAFLGVRPTMVVAGTVAAALLALLLERSRHVSSPMLPAVFGALALTGNAVSGRVTFGLGMMFGLAALVAAFTWSADLSRRPTVRRLRMAVIVVLTALTAAASGVAGLILGLVAAALWLTGDRRLSLAMGLPPLVVVVVSAWLFPLSGEQPMSWYSAVLPTAAALTAVLLFPREWRMLRVLGLVYFLAVQLAWLVPSPVGTNISRLGLIFAGVGLVATLPGRDWARSSAAARLGRTLSAGLVGAALITSVSWQVGLAARDAISTAPPTSLSLNLQPLVEQLEARGAGLGRVEVVPTASHREVAALAPYANLARGWNRQADAGRNRLFYRDVPLTADAYQRWLRRWAVRFVVLSEAKPDVAAVEEAALVADGLPYLDRVWSDDEWTLYEVRRPRPLVSEPAEVLSFDSALITLSTPEPGPIVVRVAYSQWLGLLDAGGEPLPTDGADGPDGVQLEQPCLSGLATDRGVDNPRDNWLVLHATEAGVYRIGAPYKMPRGSACAS
ncbi:MFS transporter [Nocardioides bigeumensis]|uniref:MFS transporter n=1 Tax=Nocardioides bigeumensis TaxID=433657 RepID=A0ABN2Y5I4_9ACTN